MTKLFSPITVGSLEVRNRIWIAPMCMYSCENRDGVPTDFHLAHLGARALGGAGLIVVEATAVEAIGRITPWDTGIWNDEQVAGWKRVTALIHTTGAKVAIQLAHAGRKASTHRGWSGDGSIPVAEGGWQSVSSTSEAFDGYAAPRELSTTEVQQLPALFAAAATRSIEAGFDAVQLHAAHGYLLHEFLSPLSNQRQDEFCGSLENRARLLLDTVRAVRAVLPAGMPLMVRFSGTDYVDGGWDIDSTAQVAKWCEVEGADMFDISSGGLVVGAKIPLGPGYQVPLAEYVAERVGEPVSAVGQISEGLQAEQILQAGEVSVIMIGRASLRDPNWPIRIASELGVDIDYLPNQYSRAGW